MKPLHYEISGRSLFLLTLTCVLGAPLVGMAAAFAYRIFLQLQGILLPAPLALLLSWTTLIVLSSLLFGRVVWLGRIQHPWLVGAAGVVFGLAAYLAFLVAGSRFPGGAVPGLMFPGWPNLILLGGLLAMLLIPNVIQSQEHVCENCRRWYEAARQVGSVPFAQREEFLSLLDRGQIHDAGHCIVAEEQSAPPDLEIYRQTCPACQISDPVITIKETYLNGQGMVKRRVLRRGTVSYLDARELASHPAGERLESAA